MPRRISWRRIRKDRNYTVDDARRVLDVSKGTVRRWIKDGLPALKDCRPHLILGGDLIAYLKARTPPKQSCRLDECYCFTCRAPRRAAFAEAEYRPSNATRGNLRALCEVCTTVMNKQISQARLSELDGLLTVSIRHAGRGG